MQSYNITTETGESVFTREKREFTDEFEIQFGKIQKNGDNKTENACFVVKNPIKSINKSYYDLTFLSKQKDCMHILIHLPTSNNVTFIIPDTTTYFTNETKYKELKNSKGSMLDSKSVSSFSYKKADVSLTSTTKTGSSLLVSSRPEIKKPEVKITQPKPTLKRPTEDDNKHEQPPIKRQKTGPNTEYKITQEPEPRTKEEKQKAAAKKMLNAFAAEQIQIGNGRTLREHQHDILRQIANLRSRQYPCKSVVEMPTGSGKTVMFSQIITTTNEKTLIVVPGNTIAEQIQQELINQNRAIRIATVNFTNKKNKKEYLNDLFDKNNVVISTYANLCGRSKKDGNVWKYELLPWQYITLTIFDEAHYLTAEKRPLFLRKAFEEGTDCFAFTATPYMTDTKTVFAALGIKEEDNPIKGITITQAIKDKICTPATVTAITPINMKFGKFDKSNSEYKMDRVANELNRNEIHAAIADVYVNGKNKITNEYYRGKTTMIFCCNIEHAKSLAKYLNDNISINDLDPDYTLRDRYVKNASNGERLTDEQKKKIRNEVKIAAVVTSKTQKEAENPDKTNKDIIADFKRGRYPILISVMKLAEGFDHPPVDLIFFDRLTKKSIRTLLQAFGRGERLNLLKPNKTCHFIHITPLGIPQLLLNQLLMDPETQLLSNQYGVIHRVDDVEQKKIPVYVDDEKKIEASNYYEYDNTKLSTEQLVIKGKRKEKVKKTPSDKPNPLQSKSKKKRAKNKTTITEAELRKMDKKIIELEKLFDQLKNRVVYEAAESKDKDIEMHDVHHGKKEKVERPEKLPKLATTADEKVAEDLVKKAKALLKEIGAYTYLGESTSSSSTNTALSKEKDDLLIGATFNNYLKLIAEKKEKIKKQLAQAALISRPSSSSSSGSDDEEMPSSVIQAPMEPLDTMQRFLNSMQTENNLNFDVKDEKPSANQMMLNINELSQSAPSKIAESINRVSTSINPEPNDFEKIIAEAKKDKDKPLGFYVESKCIDFIDNNKIPLIQKGSQRSIIEKDVMLKGMVINSGSEFYEMMVLYYNNDVHKSFKNCLASLSNIDLLGFRASDKSLYWLRKIENKQQYTINQFAEEFINFAFLENKIINRYNFEINIDPVKKTIEITSEDNIILRKIRSLLYHYYYTKSHQTEDTGRAFEDTCNLFTHFSHALKFDLTHKPQKSWKYLKEKFKYNDCLESFEIFCMIIARLAKDYTKILNRVTTSEGKVCIKNAKQKLVKIKKDFSEMKSKKRAEQEQKYAESQQLTFDSAMVPISDSLRNTTSSVNNKSSPFPSFFNSSSSQPSVSSSPFTLFFNSSSNQSSANATSFISFSNSSMNQSSVSSTMLTPFLNSSSSSQLVNSSLNQFSQIVPTFVLEELLRQQSSLLTNSDSRNSSPPNLSSSPSSTSSLRALSFFSSSTSQSSSSSTEFPSSEPQLSSGPPPIPKLPDFNF